MTAHADNAGSNGHGHHDSPDHHPHVTPLKYYFGVWIMLLVFTAITVGVSYVDFGVLNLVIALTVATMKAAMVSLIFMHLLWDNKFNAFAFVSSLVFLGIFIGFTMMDTETRGSAEIIENAHPKDISQPFAGTRVLDELAPTAGKASHESGAHH